MEHQSFSDQLETLRRDRPGIYASRHVVKAVAQVLVFMLGVGAALRALLPRLDFGWAWEWNPPFDVSRIPDPLGWIAGWLWARLDAGVTEVLIDLVRSFRWWGPIAIAVVVALNEIERRRSRERDQRDPGAATESDAGAATEPHGSGEDPALVPTGGRDEGAPW